MDYEKIVLSLLERIDELENKVSDLEWRLNDLDGGEEPCNPLIMIEKNCLMSKPTISQVEQISNYISDAITEAISKGLNHIIITSGKVHNILGLKNRIPSVCSAMRKVVNEDPRIKNHVVTKDTPSHNSSTYTIRYEF